MDFQFYLLFTLSLVKNLELDTNESQRGFFNIIVPAFGFLKREIVAILYFKKYKMINPLLIHFLENYDLSLLAEMIVWSPDFREFFIEAKQKSTNNQILKKMHRYLIIEPISKIQWKNNLANIIHNYSITDQGLLPICWAHAISSTIYLSQSRIIGRKVEPFLQIREKLLNQFGKNGNNPVKVMKEVLPKYKLHFNKISVNDTLSVIKKGRVCVSSFWLSSIQWYNFDNFFNNPINKTRAITSKELNRELTNIELKSPLPESGSHAVVLVNVSKNEFTFMNSWGANWGDHGFFRVEKSAFDIIFYDIFWYENELTDEDKKIWNERSDEAIKTFYDIIEKADFIIQNDIIIQIPRSEFVLKQLNEMVDNFWRL